MSSRGYYGQYESNDFASTDGQDTLGNYRNDPLIRLAKVVKVYATATEDFQAGTIQFRVMLESGELQHLPTNALEHARPYNTYMFALPVINEYVYIMPGPVNISTRPDMDELKTCPNYYLNPIAMRGDINHNASDREGLIPLLDRGTLKVSAEEYDTQIEEGTKSKDDPFVRTELGNDFHRNSTFEKQVEETLVMAPAIYEGDVLFNGRFGQSIRLSATISEGANKTWRGTPDLEADPPYLKPITIIRNGLPEKVIEKKKDEYIDNIITDPTAIYLTNGQYIPELKDYQPFPKAPTGKEKLSRKKTRANAMNLGELFEHADLGNEVNQCIIRSDRIMQLARKEIYHWSEKGISLATVGAITLDANEVIIDGLTIQLGTGAGDNKHRDADLNNAVRGEKLKQILLDILSAFDTTTTTCGAGPGVLNPPPSLSKLYDDVVDAEESGLFSKKVFLE